MRTKIFDKDFGHYIINCPGCKSQHVIAVDKPFSNGAKWGFNGNLELPTFTPSLLIRTGKYAGGEEWYKGLKEEQRKFVDEHSEVCHSFITNGRIQYLGDCTHSLANQTIDLPEIEINQLP